MIFFDIGRKVALTIDAVNRMATLAHVEHYPGRARMRSKRGDIYKYKEECVMFLLRFPTRLIAFRLTFRILWRYEFGSV